MSDAIYETTDEELIKFLITKKARILKTEKNGRNRTVFQFSRPEIQIHLDEWLSGAPIMVEIRDVFQSAKIFNMRVHDDI
jgi:hypothetical protein